MKDCPLDLHLDEDVRLALTDEEMKERLLKFNELEEQTIQFRKREKKVQNEIKRLSSRRTTAKKDETKRSLDEKIGELNESVQTDVVLMTVAEAKANNALYDLRFNPGDTKLPTDMAKSGMLRASVDDKEFYFKHEDLISSLTLFNPSSPPSLYEKLARMRREYRLKKGIEKNTFYEDVILPKVSVSGWIRAIARVSRAIPTLVQLIDNELNLISTKPEELSLNGVSTVRLLERFTSKLRLKDLYLNVFVLDKEFQSVLKTKFERQVYDCFIKKSKRVRNTIEASRVRTAYRYRTSIVQKIKDKCDKLGYDKNWFIENFGELPPIKKLLTDEFEKEAGQVKEELEKQWLESGKNSEVAGSLIKSCGRPLSDAEKVIMNLKPWELLGMSEHEFYFPG